MKARKFKAVVSVFLSATLLFSNPTFIYALVVNNPTYTSDIEAPTPGPRPTWAPSTPRPSPSLSVPTGDDIFVPDESAPVNPCGDGRCDKGGGEDKISCPIDCSSPTLTSAPRCGDGRCDKADGENSTNCHKDCGVHAPTVVVSNGSVTNPDIVQEADIDPKQNIIEITGSATGGSYDAAPKTSQTTGGKYVVGDGFCSPEEYSASPDCAAPSAIRNLIEGIDALLPSALGGSGRVDNLSIFKGLTQVFERNELEKVQDNYERTCIALYGQFSPVCDPETRSGVNDLRNATNGLQKQLEEKEERQVREAVTNNVNAICDAQGIIDPYECNRYLAVDLELPELADALVSGGDISENLGDIPSLQEKTDEVVSTSEITQMILNYCMAHYPTVLANCANQFKDVKTTFEFSAVADRLDYDLAMEACRSQGGDVNVRCTGELVQQTIENATPEEIENANLLAGERLYQDYGIVVTNFSDQREFERQVREQAADAGLSESQIREILAAREGYKNSGIIGAVSGDSTGLTAEEVRFRQNYLQNVGLVEGNPFREDNGLAALEDTINTNPYLGVPTLDALGVTLENTMLGAADPDFWAGTIAGIFSPNNYDQTYESVHNTFERVNENIHNSPGGRYVASIGSNTLSSYEDRGVEHPVTVGTLRGVYRQGFAMTVGQILSPGNANEVRNAFVGVDIDSENNRSILTDTAYLWQQSQGDNVFERTGDYVGNIVDGLNRVNGLLAARDFAAVTGQGQGSNPLMSIAGSGPFSSGVECSAVNTEACVDVHVREDLEYCENQVDLYISQGGNPSERQELLDRCAGYMGSGYNAAASEYYRETTVRGGTVVADAALGMVLAPAEGFSALGRIAANAAPSAAGNLGLSSWFYNPMFDNRYDGAARNASVNCGLGNDSFDCWFAEQAAWTGEEEDKKQAAWDAAFAIVSTVAGEGLGVIVKGLARGGRVADLAVGGGAIDPALTTQALKGLPDSPIPLLDADFDTLIGRNVDISSMEGLLDNLRGNTVASEVLVDLTGDFPRIVGAEPSVMVAEEVAREVVGLPGVSEGPGVVGEAIGPGPREAVFTEVRSAIEDYWNNVSESADSFLSDVGETFGIGGSGRGGGNVDEISDQEWLDSLLDQADTSPERASELADRFGTEENIDDWFNGSPDSGPRVPEVSFDNLRTESGTELPTTFDPVGAGRTGTVYQGNAQLCPNGPCVVKVFNGLYAEESLIDQFVRADFVDLVRRHNGSGGSLYPRPGELILNGNGSAVGYTMEEIQGVALRNFFNGNTYTGPEISQGVWDNFMGQYRAGVGHGDLSGGLDKVKEHLFLIVQSNTSGEVVRVSGIRLIDPAPLSAIENSPTLLLGELNNINNVWGLIQQSSPRGIGQQVLDFAGGLFGGGQ